MRGSKRRVVWAVALAALAGACRERPAPRVAPADEASPALPAEVRVERPADGVVLGRRIDGLLPERWLGSPVPLAGEGAAKATLVRFWTDTCPYCARSLPRIEALRARLGPRGLATVGIYHPKPPRPVADEDVADAAARLGFGGPVAIDEDWSALRAVWLHGDERRATSALFLVDAHGVVRYVHPGPELFDDDLAELERAFEELLAGG